MNDDFTNLNGDDVMRRALDVGAEKLEMDRKVKAVVGGLLMGALFGVVIGVIAAKVA
jgi:hypothetical protein